MPKIDSFLMLIYYYVRGSTDSRIVDTIEAICSRDLKLLIKVVRCGV